MANRHNDDDRPKRTWREIDKMRSGGFSRSRAKSEREEERKTRSPQYELYKAKLDKLFSGEEIPEQLADQLDPTGTLKARETLIKRIKKAATEDRKAWSEAVTELSEKFEMPQDAYLLVDFLDHPKDRVVDKSLARIEQLFEQGALAGPKVPKSLDQRLRALELTGTDPELQQRARDLRGKLKG